jgi:hypothetical protein
VTGRLGTKNDERHEGLVATKHNARPSKVGGIIVGGLGGGHFPPHHRRGLAAPGLSTASVRDTETQHNDRIVNRFASHLLDIAVRRVLVLLPIMDSRYLELRGDSTPHPGSHYVDAQVATPTAGIPNGNDVTVATGRGQCADAQPLAPLIIVTGPFGTHWRWIRDAHIDFSLLCGRI